MVDCNSFYSCTVQFSFHRQLPIGAHSRDPTQGAESILASTLVRNAIRRVLKNSSRYKNDIILCIRLLTINKQTVCIRALPSLTPTVQCILASNSLLLNSYAQYYESYSYSSQYLLVCILSYLLLVLYYLKCSMHNTY